MAHTKAGGSTRNDRDSRGQRLGIKLGDGQFCTAGSIIFRQRGTKIFPGTNCGRGNDDTLFALITGYVKFETRRNRTYASVYPERVSSALSQPVVKKVAVKKEAAPKVAAKKPATKKATTTTKKVSAAKKATK